MSARRSGFSLLELMLVMMLILIAAALTAPVIETMLSDGRVKAARDMLRARWADARGRAMREGRPYKFSIIAGTGKFKVEPEDAGAPSEADDPPLILEGELPEEIVFNTEQGANATGDYQPIAVYLPDGTARDDVQVMFGKAGAQSLGLHLRALTGAVTMVDPQPLGREP